MFDFRQNATGVLRTVRFRHDILQVSVVFVLSSSDVPYFVYDICCVCCFMEVDRFEPDLCWVFSSQWPMRACLRSAVVQSDMNILQKHCTIAACVAEPAGARLAPG